MGEDKKRLEERCEQPIEYDPFGEALLILYRFLEPEFDYIPRKVIIKERKY